jgi:hypothetical protein
MTNYLRYPVFDTIFFSKAQKHVKVKSEINLHLGSGSASQDYGLADPDPKEIFMDPQH